MLSWAKYTHPGRRGLNQDAVLVAPIAGRRALVAVADGMGGHSAGEVASRIALDVLRREVEAGTDLKEAVERANEVVYREAAEVPGQEGMGTTLVAALVSEKSYRLANVGDSRAYRIGRARIQQLTEDHSVVAQSLRDGQMTPAEAARSPWREALTRALGTDRTVDVDIFGPYPIDEPHVVLLCSDGLHKAVDDQRIERFVMGTQDIETAVRALAALAYRRRSDDNITVAAVEFGRLARPSRAVTLPIPIERQLSTARPRGATSRDTGIRVPESRSQKAGVFSHRRQGRRGSLVVGALMVMAVAVGIGMWVHSQQSEGVPAETPVETSATEGAGGSEGPESSDRIRNEGERGGAGETGEPEEGVGPGTDSSTVSEEEGSTRDTEEGGGLPW